MASEWPRNGLGMASEWPKNGLRMGSILPRGSWQTWRTSSWPGASEPVRTGHAHQPPACCTHQRRRAACPGAPRTARDRRTRTSLGRAVTCRVPWLRVPWHRVPWHRVPWHHRRRARADSFLAALAAARAATVESGRAVLVVGGAAPCLPRFLRLRPLALSTIALGCSPRSRGAAQSGLQYVRASGAHADVHADVLACASPGPPSSA